MNLGGRLLALYLEDEDDLQEMYWNLAGGPLNDPAIQAMLTTSQTGNPITYPGAGGAFETVRSITDYDLTAQQGVAYNHNNPNHREAMMDAFSEG